MPNGEDFQRYQREFVSQLRRDRDQAVRDRERAQSRFDRYDLAVRGLEGLLEEGDADEREPNGSASPPATTNGHSPRTIDAVERVLREAGADGLSVAAVTRALAQRGWLPDSKNPPTAVRAAGDRLRVRDPNFILADGKLAYRPARLSTQQESTSLLDGGEQ